MQKEEVVIYAALVVGAVVLGWALYSIFVPQQQYPDAQKYFAAQTSDPCATPEGYTDEQWIEHMGHHPDTYKECLAKLGR